MNFKTIKYHLKVNKEERILLQFLMHISKNIYNYALYTLRKDYFENGRIDTYFSYNKRLWNNENIHILNTYQSICTIRSCYYGMETFIKRKKYIPHYLNKEGYYPLITDQIRPIVIKNKKYLKLPLSNILRTNNIYKKEYQDELINKFIKELKQITIKAIKIPIPKIIKEKTIHQLRIVPNKYGTYFEVEMTYENEEETIALDEKKYLSMDLGINNLCACVDNDNNSFIIDGKKLKSYNQFYNKQRSYYQSKLTNNKNSKRLQRITRKHNNLVNDYLNKAVNQIKKIVKEKKIKNIVIGYNKGLKNKGIKNDLIKGKDKKRINQSFVSIPISRFKEKIKYQLENIGCKVKIINESYTSKASFYDNDEMIKGKYSGERIKRGLYETHKGILVNADINASLNILRKSNPNLECIKLLRGRGLTIPTRIQVNL